MKVMDIWRGSKQELSRGEKLINVSLPYSCSVLFHRNILLLDKASQVVVLF
jgi:hypothetical protein